MDLSYNVIQRISFQKIDLRIDIPFHLNISGNPLICDCKAQELKQMLTGADNEIFKNIDIQPKDIKCGLNNPPVTAGKMLSEVDYHDLNCESNECSEDCKCFYNRYYRETLMDCSNKVFISYFQYQ